MPFPVLAGSTTTTEGRRRQAASVADERSSQDGRAERAAHNAPQALVVYADDQELR